MKEVTVQCSEETTSRMLHNALADALDFPEWYGKNLDALHDCLAEIGEDTHLTVVNLSYLDRFAVGFRRVLLDAQEENPHLKVTIL